MPSKVTCEMLLRLIMDSVICFHHPDYDGTDAPDLGCKNCCAKFIGLIREKQSRRFAPKRKLQKSDLEKSVANMNQRHKGVQINPEGI